MKKRRSFIFLFLFFQISHASVERVEKPEPSFFFANLRPYLYFGHDLNVGIIQAPDAYSVFQYILDCGIEKKDEPLRTSTIQTISYSAKGRIKGLVGHPGSGMFPLQETEIFQGWLREGFLLYAPCEDKNNFIQAGYFPFKLGTGLVLGNAYNINIPISWEYIYEQINQFRPGILVQVDNQQHSLTAQAYVGFASLDSNFESTVSPTLLAFLTPLLEKQQSAPLPTKAAPNVVAAFQVIFCPFRNHSIQLCPYLFFHKANQSIETSNDATSTVYTPGFFASFKHKDIAITVELAKNCGHQQIKPLDRNAVLPEYIYYDPHADSAATISVNHLIPSPFVLPASITTPSGNGGIFTFATNPSTTSVFKNAYDRFRNGYRNEYTGCMLYADFLLTRKNISWAVGALYTSGDNNPNDSYDTILMTRLTPGTVYKDHNKTYSGFVGADQYYEIDYLNPLYYGTGDFNYTNLAYIGSTFEYRWGISEQPLSAQFTLMAYLKPFSPSLNVTNHHGVRMNSSLGHYLGTEINYSATYTSAAKEFTLSLLGGIFFPGTYFNSFKKELVTLEASTARLISSDTTNHPVADTSSANTTFFISFGGTWLFDSLPFLRIFNHA